MRNWVVICAVAVLCLATALTAHADAIPVFGTGLDASGHLLTTQSPDPHYSLTVNPQGGNGPYVTDTSNYPFINPQHPNTIWVANTPTSQWISPQPTYTSSISDASGDYTYHTTFNMTGLNPATAQLNGLFAVDAVLSDILINGTSTGVTGNSQTGLTPFTISSGFVSGINTLDFLVVNNVQANGNTTGMQVQLSGSAAAVPEPGSFVLLSSFLILTLHRRHSC